MTSEWAMRVFCTHTHTYFLRWAFNANVPTIPSSELTYNFLPNLPIVSYTSTSEAAALSAGSMSSSELMASLEALLRPVEVSNRREIAEVVVVPLRFLEEKEGRETKQPYYICVHLSSHNISAV